MTTGLLAQLTARGIVEHCSDAAALDKLFATETVAFYTGYDPTASSLQIGNLFAIVTMRRLQLAGHKPVVIVGGATGMIGDPSGKSVERVLLSAETVEKNIAAQKKQFQKLLDFDDPKNGALLLNNYDWLGKFSFIDFLREVGARFRLGEMLAKESVKRRLESPVGLSFTEFCYQLLQSYDFCHLRREYGVKLQVGGADQWGNIAAGIDYTRKSGAEVFGLVVPLVTDANGKKFGKSEGGTIYLDPNVTSPYQMYQFLLNAEDAMVVKYLNYFTFLPDAEVAELARVTQTAPEKRAAQKALAGEVVRMVHGAEGLSAAENATKIFFGAKIENLSDAQLNGIFADVPAVALPRRDLDAGIKLVDLLAQTPLFASKGEARRSLQQNGVTLNNEKIADADKTITAADLASETLLVLRKGKKSYCLARFQ
ncbi:MAG: tyrosine--tRNA ligase [Planctomycetota bacterium]|jgi:tyrosyl-tRNA synthetase|nr:tyrosine--tRNA ligase [Planctomycetota bacterium]